MSAPHLENGRIVAQRYTVRRLVAHAETSSIYEAITAPNREILLELFAQEVGRSLPDLPALLARITTEVSALPTSIVLPVVEAGIDAETGCPFIASAASVTPTLAELVKLCPLGGDELAAFAARLCAAVDAIHSRGLVHGALDPLTVFVGPAPRCDVRVGGLGSSMLAAQSNAAPTIADDVHAAALLVLFAATGALPEDPRAAMLAAKYGKGPPPPFDARLGEPLAQALSPDPSERPSSAGELGRAISDALGSSFVVSSPWLLAAQPAGASLDAVTASIASPTDPLPDALGPLPMAAAPVPPRKQLPPARTIAIVVVAVATFSIGGGALALALTGAAKKPAIAATSSAAPPPPSIASTPAPVSAPTHTPDPDPAPAPDPPPATPPPSDTEASLVVRCIPECDWVRVDGKTVPAWPATFAPGSHVVVAKRTWHPPQTRYVKLTSERETAVQFVWFKPKDAPATTPPPKTAPPKKPCGKFLQRCD